MIIFLMSSSTGALFSLFLPVFCQYFKNCFTPSCHIPAQPISPLVNSFPVHVLYLKCICWVLCLAVCPIYISDLLFTTTESCFIIPLCVYVTSYSGSRASTCLHTIPGSWMFQLLNFTAQTKFLCEPIYNNILQHLHNVERFYLMSVDIRMS